MIEIHTDGSYHTNYNIGAYAAIITENDEEKEISGLEKNPSSSDEMELLAVFRSIESIKESKLQIDLYSDSQYVISRINNKMNKWANNWPKILKYKETWQKIYEMRKNLKINFHQIERNSSKIKRCHEIANNLVKNEINKNKTCNIDELIKELNESANSYNQKYRAKDEKFRYNLEQIENVLKYIPEIKVINIKETNNVFLSWNGKEFCIYEKSNNNKQNIYKVSLQNENDFPSKFFKDTDKMINDFLMKILDYINQSKIYLN